jgi:hypothetical protein
MKTINKIASLLFVLALFQNCKKEGDGTIFNAYFYAASYNSNDGQMILYIDGVSKGDLPYLAYKSINNNDSIKKATLFMNLKSGNYILEAKTKSGTLISKAKIFVASNESSGSSAKGGEYTILYPDNSLFIGLGE